MTAADFDVIRCCLLAALSLIPQKVVYFPLHIPSALWTGSFRCLSEKRNLKVVCLINQLRIGPGQKQSPSEWPLVASALAQHPSSDFLGFPFDSPETSPKSPTILPRMGTVSLEYLPSLDTSLLSFSPVPDSTSSACSSAIEPHQGASYQATSIISNPSAFDGFPSGCFLVERTEPLADRKHRRREQNRKAQSNFRQKRKEELRRLELEIQDLRTQLAGRCEVNDNPTWTICTRCRNFYPASLGGMLSHPIHSEQYATLKSGLKPLLGCNPQDEPLEYLDQPS